MKKRIVLIGKSASGKDHARKICETWFGMPYQVSYTTRPPRWDEDHGKDYFFITNEDAMDMIKNEKFYEHVEFNGWIYGTTKDQFYADGSVFIMTPTGLSHLPKKDRDDSLVIYFDIEEGIRRSRMQERQGNADSVHRRLEADHTDFLNFTDCNVTITDPYFLIRDLYNIISEHVELKNKDKFFLDNDNSLTKVYNFSTN